MKFLVTGSGTSGSWVIRGEQLGRAAGGTVVPRAVSIAGYDVLVCVKRTDPALLRAARAAHVPVVWDVVDAWPQPEGNEWDRTRAMQWLADTLAAVRPSIVLAATRRMALDISSLGTPAICVPHHARVYDRDPEPLKEHVRLVAYEGAPHYLGKWERALQEQCALRGWRFVVNPPHYAHADLVVAVRSYEGYPAASWKSNVKLANAQGLGLPFIGSREQGYLETATPGAEVFVDSPKDLDSAFERLTTRAARQTVRDKMLVRGFELRLQEVARLYRSIIEGLA